MSGKSATFPSFISLPVTPKMIQALKCAARAEDRSVASYIRRLIAADLGMDIGRPSGPEDKKGRPSKA